jgi:hypothetical protein
MKATLHPVSFAVTIVGSLSILALAGCMYSLPVPGPPSQERIRIVAKSPENYLVRVDFGYARDYPVPADGKLNLVIQVVRRRCNVSLFGWIKVGGGADPVKTGAITVRSNGTLVRKLSLKEFHSLATDSDGYRLLKIAD